MDELVRVVVNEGGSTSVEDLAPVGPWETADELWKALTEGHFHPLQMVPTVSGQFVRVGFIARAFRVSAGPSEAVVQMFAHP